MSYPDVFLSGPAEAPRCTCTAVIVATLAETLGCPNAWYELADGSWAHTDRINAGAGLRAGVR